MSDDVAQDRRVLDDAIAQVAAEPDDERMVTAWVLVLEYVDLEGQTYLMSLGSENNSAWKRDGMLSHAISGAIQLDRIEERVEE